MPYLKLHRDEPEAEAPQPLPFDPSGQSWRSTDDTSLEGDHMDSIQQVEEALGRVERSFESLSEQVDEICEPIKMSDWLVGEDDEPYAA